MRKLHDCVSPVSDTGRPRGPDPHGRNVQATARLELDETFPVMGPVKRGDQRQSGSEQTAFPRHRPGVFISAGFRTPAGSIPTKVNNEQQGGHKPDRLTPETRGAQHGIGQKFPTDLQTGTLKFAVAIALPTAVTKSNINCACVSRGNSNDPLGTAQTGAGCLCSPALGGSSDGVQPIVSFRSSGQMGRRYSAEPM
jgi:hypothetical protein